jgi:hypothetical protein
MSNEQRTPNVSDADLLAYLEGEADESVAQEIEASTSYDERLRELARQERTLVAGLYRSSCPEAHELGEYHMELLPGERAALVAQHLEDCPHCALELRELRAYLDELAPELDYSLLERVRVLVARLAPEFDSLSGGLQPAPALAGIRGEENRPYLYEAGEAQISLEVQDDADSAGRKSVLGLVMGVEAGDWQATLWQDNHVEGDTGTVQLQAQAVDALGNFVFQALDPGTYRLVLRGEDVEVVIQDLAVK